MSGDDYMDPEWHQQKADAVLPNGTMLEFKTGKDLNGQENEDLSTLNLDWFAGVDMAMPRLVLAEDTRIGGWLIPMGFRTDGATLPGVVRRWFSPFGPYLPAAVLHDFLLEVGAVSRKEAAVQFKACLKRLGMPSWLVNSFYGSVRLNDRWVRFKGWFK